MTEFIATTPGVFPLPDWAKDRLGSLKGHQKEDLVDGDEGEEITDVYDEARAAVADWQTTAGLHRIGEGQLRWDDMLAHPLCVHDAVETRGIVRYYDNNNFYREPVVSGELTFDGDLADDLDAFVAMENAPESVQAVVPGPYSLTDLATDEFYGDEAAFLDGIANFLAGEVRAFPDVETVFVLEPSLVTNPPSDDLAERASEALDAVAGATSADVVVQTYWGALTEKVHAHVLDADVDAVGYDFVTNHEDNLYNINEYGTKDDIVARSRRRPEHAGRRCRESRANGSSGSSRRFQRRSSRRPTSPPTPNCSTSREQVKAKFEALAEGAALAEADA